ncbi:MAG: hypothetical protein O2799_06870, partial [Planctomycetota bacterium]|nr:hypothetical protein [Planctomycetota bacterium]
QVVVRDPKTKAAFRSAEVLMIDRSTMDLAWTRALAEAGGIRQLMRGSGTRFPCDEQGVAVVPQILNGVVYANEDGYEGWYEWIGPIQGPLTLDLKPAIDLQVRVVDPTGQPVPNVPVVVCVRDWDNPRALMETASVSPSGIASFRRMEASLGSRSSNQSYAVRLGIPLARAEMIPIDLANLPTTPLVLTRPPAGRLMVRIVGGDGQPIPRADVCLGAYRANPLNSAEQIFVAEEVRMGAAGFARFESVPVDSRPLIRISGDSEKEDLIAEVEAPPGEAQAVEVTLVWDTLAAALVARALDSGARPIPNRRGRLQLVQDGVAQGGGAILTDGEGRFRVPLRSPWKPGATRKAKLEFFPEPEVAPLTAEIDLSFELEAGDNAYGDIVFHGLPLLASGICLGPDGPLEGVQVRLVRKRMTKVGAEWSPVGSLMATSGLEGRFELWGEPEGEGPFGVSGRRRGFSMAVAQDVVPPVTGLTLQFEVGEDDAGALRGGKSSRPPETPGPVILTPEEKARVRGAEGAGGRGGRRR